MKAVGLVHSYKKNYPFIYKTCHKYHNGKSLVAQCIVEWVDSSLWTSSSSKGDFDSTMGYCIRLNKTDGKKIKTCMKKEGLKL